jgi:hypothetical protein
MALGFLGSKDDLSNHPNNGVTIPIVQVIFSAHHMQKLKCRHNSGSWVFISILAVQF